MNETVCFRCDWQGRARTSHLPLVRGAPVPPRSGDVTRDPDASTTTRLVSERSPRDGSGPRGRSVAIAVVARDRDRGLGPAVRRGSEPSPAPAGTWRAPSAPERSSTPPDDGAGGSTLWTSTCSRGWRVPVRRSRPGRRSSSTCPPPLRDGSVSSDGSDRTVAAVVRGDLRRRRDRPARERRPHRVGTGWQEPRLRPQRTDRTRRLRAGQDPPGDRPHREGRVGARRSGVLRAHPVAQPEPGRDVLQRRLGRSAERVPDRHGRRPASDVRRRGHALRRRRRRRSCFDPMPPHGPRAVPRERPARCSGGRGSVAR